MFRRASSDGRAFIYVQSRSANGLTRKKINADGSSAVESKATEASVIVTNLLPSISNRLR